MNQAIRTEPDIYEAAVDGLGITVADLITQMTWEDIEDVKAGRIGYEPLRAFAKLIAEGWRSPV